MSKSSTSFELRLLVIASLALSCLSYATNLLLANSMGPESFGQYTYALVLGSLFGQVVVFGSTETGIGLKTSYGSDALDWILTAKIINFFLVVIGAVTAFLINRETAVLFALVVTLNSLSFATQYETHGRNIRYASVFLVERILITLVIWIGILFLDSQLMVWVFGSMALCQGASLFFQYIENRTTKICFRSKGLFTVYKSGLFVLVFSLSKFSFGGVTRLLIFNQLGEAQMGVFAAAWQFVPLSTLYFAQTTRTWRLRITESIKDGDSYEFSQNLKALTLFVMVPSFLAAIVCWVFGPSIIDFLLSSDYRNAGSLLPYIGVYFLVVGFDSIIVLLAIAYTRAMLAGMIYLAFGGLTILACLHLAKNHGLEGYLLIIVLGHFLAAAVLGVALSRSVRNSLQ